VESLCASGRDVECGAHLHLEVVPMRFAEGQILVHPHHGPATIRGITTRPLQGAADCPYLLLQVHDSTLTIGVPVHHAELVGLREVLAGDRLEDLLEVLRAPTGHEEAQWSRRIKDNHEKLSSGDLRRVAEVVRDLIHRRERQGLSASETSMLKDAQHLLLGELALVLELDAEAAAEHLETLCRAGQPTAPPGAGTSERPLQLAG
jgi:CarD family transcriptional regulator